MIMVLLNWLYIALTSFLTGFAVLSFFSALFTTKNKKILPQIFAGLVVNTVYAQIWSLFGGVGLWANIVLILFSLGILVIKFAQIKKLVDESLKELLSTKYMPVIYGVIVVLFVFGTSRGYIHYDTNLYHAQSIRWIEEYGVVKGLACMQLRFGYNSAAFALTALYSWVWLIGQSLHTTAGFFALLGAIQVAQIYKVFVDKKVRYSDFIRIGLLFYLGLIFREMTSPASDYYAQILIYTVIIMWLDALDAQDKDAEGYAYPFAMLSILLVYAATIKFSIALLVLLVIKPAVILIRKKQIKQIICSLCGGIVVLVPFFIRNVIISGWLIYPSTFIDLFNVDWKIPKGVAQYDAMEIGVYGKGINDVTKLDMPVSQWLPNWFMSMSLIEKGWVCLTFLSIIACIIYFVIKMIKKKVDYDRLLVCAVVIASCIFWFVSAPLVRYGYGYLTCVPLLIDGLLCYEMVNKTGDTRSLYLAFLIVVSVLGLYRAKTLSYDIMTTVKEPYYIAQKDYTNWPAEEYNLDGQTIYIPTQGTFIGYDKFPSSVLTIDVELRGEGFEDGFRFKDYEGFINQYEQGK